MKNLTLHTKTFKVSEKSKKKFEKLEIPSENSEDLLTTFEFMLEFDVNEDNEISDENFNTSLDVFKNQQKLKIIKIKKPKRQRKKSINFPVFTILSILVIVLIGIGTFLVSSGSNLTLAGVTWLIGGFLGFFISNQIMDGDNFGLGILYGITSFVIFILGFFALVI